MRREIVIAAMTTLLGSVMLAACGKPQDRPMVSDANAPEHKSSRPKIEVWGCLYQSPDDKRIVNLQKALMIDRTSRGVELRFRDAWVIYTYATEAEADKGHIDVLRSWRACLDGLGVSLIVAKD